MANTFDPAIHPHQWFCGGLDPCACMDSWKDGGYKNAVVDFATIEGELVYYEEQGDHVSITVGNVKLFDYLSARFGVPDTGEGIDAELKFGRVKITVERLTKAS